jgi:hypothetical protein
MGGRKSQASQPLRITALEPASAEGLDCDGGACGFAPNASIRLKFDRWLLPTTAVRQSASLSTEGTGLGVFLRPDYDVTARVLSFRPDAPLAPDTAYIVQFSNADNDPNGFGFRSYDGDSLGRSIRFAFRTTSTELPAQTGQTAPVVTCPDVLAALASAGCASAGCHSGKQPRMGLSLDSQGGLLATAVDQVAHETESGTEPTQQAVSGGRFGVQMPIIDAGRPENSYLMYKVLISRWLNQELDSIADRPDPFAAESLSSSQIEAARAWFIGFGAMPPDEVGYPDGVSAQELVQTLNGWIRAGAACE